MTKYYQNMSPSKVETWLPIFPGFYYTIFSFDDEDYEIEYYEEQREQAGHKKHPEHDEYQFDYEGYETEYCNRMTSAIEAELKSLGFITVSYTHLTLPTTPYV